MLARVRAIRACIGRRQSRSARPVRSRKTSSSVARRTPRFCGSTPRASAAARSAPIVARDVDRVQQDGIVVVLHRARPRAGPRGSRRRAPSIVVEPDGALLEPLRDELVDGPHLEDVAVVHDREAVAQDLGLLHVVRRQQDRPAVALERQDEVPQRRAGRPGRGRSSARRGRRAPGRLTRARATARRWRWPPDRSARPGVRAARRARARR